MKKKVKYLIRKGHIPPEMARKLDRQIKKIIVVREGKDG